MNRAERRALERAEKKMDKKGIEASPQLTDNCRQWISFMDKNNVNFNAFFVGFSGWLNLSKNEKMATVVELVSQGKVIPDEENKGRVKTGWHKVDAEGNIIYDEDELEESNNAEEQDSEG